MSPSAVERVVHADRDQLAGATATRLLARLADAQAARGRVGVVLTGGTVGTEVLRRLAAAAPSPSAGAVDWSAVDLWWGDERFLPAGDPDRNETQAREAALDVLVGAGLDPARIHAMPASDGPDGDDLQAAADRYAADLAAVAAETGVGGPVPVFDVLLLGVGPDGHVASLFPGLEQVDVTGASVVPVTASPKPPPLRLSLTLPVINGAEEVWCVVAGADKAEAVARALSDEGQLAGDLPASRATGVQRTLWLLDEAAASRL